MRDARARFAVAGLMCVALLCGCASVVGGARRIDVATLVSEVAAGRNFEGVDLVVTGVAMGSQDRAGLVNLGTRDFLEFISVYGVERPAYVYRGMPLALSVRVQRASAVPSVSGKPVVMVNATYKDCVSCKR